MTLSSVSLGYVYTMQLRYSHYLTSDLDPAPDLHGPYYPIREYGSNWETRLRHRRPGSHTASTQAPVHQLRGCHHWLCLRQDFLRLYSHAHRDQDLDDGSSVVYYRYDECYHVALCYLLSGSMQAGGGTLGCQASSYRQMLADRSV